MDRAHADRQREEDLPRRREPDGGVSQLAEVGFPDVVQPHPGAFDHGRILGRVGRQALHGQDAAEEDQERHGHLGHHLDAAGDSSREDEDVDADADGEHDEAGHAGGEDLVLDLAGNPAEEG